MFINYFKIALRHLLKNSVYSFINITGLSVGLACSILILLWVSDEMSFDTFHKNADRIHEVWINAEYDLVTLIVKEFSWLVVVALVIAGPLSWWGLEYFLEQYAYRIEFPWWVIVVAGGSAMIFAMAIVGTQALRAALENPVKSLTSE